MEDPDDGREPGQVVPLPAVPRKSAKRLPGRTTAAKSKPTSKPAARSVEEQAQADSAVHAPAAPSPTPVPPPPPTPADLAAAGITVPPRPPLPAETPAAPPLPEKTPVTAEPSVEDDGAPAGDVASAEDEAAVADGAPVGDVAPVDDGVAAAMPEGLDESLEDTVIATRVAGAPEPEGVVEPLIAPAAVASPAVTAPERQVADVKAPPARVEAVRAVAPPAAATGEAALVIRGITKSFGDTRAVEGIDLTVPAGTFYGLVGPNGAGKTTTLSMVAGLLRPDKGTITVAGVDAASHPLSVKRMMGVLPDRLRTFDRLTGRQLLYYYGVLRGLSPAVVERRTADLARAFDLTEALGRAVSDYSAGMTKKVMLAGALIHSPRLLVLDEPFESVDPVSSAIILDILSTYVSHGGTVILSSHGMDLVERVCSRVAVIVAGQVLAEGTIDEVRGELTLEQRFIELAGGLSDVEGLEWLHTFSD